MRFQSSQSSCGPASLRNALLCHGIIRSEEELEALAGTKASDGTGPKGLIKALQAIAREHPEVTPAPLSEAREDVAVLKLLATLAAHHVVILSVDRDEHWVVAFGFLGSGAKVSIHVCDSADNEMVKHYGPAELLARWRGLGRKPFFGVIV